VSVALVLVTGTSGSGKSAVCESLRARGHEAHDMDLDGNAAWMHRATGEHWPAGVRPDTGAPDWFAQYEWRAIPEKIEALAGRGGEHPVFLCGMTTNGHEVWHLYSRVVYVSVDERTLRERLASRTTNDFGKTREELDAIFVWHGTAEEQHRDAGATMVDATLPLDQVVDAVLAASLEV
jgi:gluconate kinase